MYYWKLFLLSIFFCCIAFVGGDPKPQHLERTRVVGLEHTKSNQRFKDHRRHRTNSKSHSEETKKTSAKPAELETKFKLWADGPNFDTNLRQNVVALVGRTAYLTCRVFDRGNKTVSWIRHHDLHILTVGGYTYTADMRFRSIYNTPSGQDEWILQIQYVQKRDAGRYECQLNTQPVRSFFVQLSVVDSLPDNELFKMNDASSSGQHVTKNKNYHHPGNEEAVASILGNPNVFIESGSVLNLTCLVKHALSKPAFIIWKHGSETINYSSPRGGISVETNTSGNIPRSYLLIDSVAPSDSGKYSCHPANAKDVSVTVHIQDGEHQAAIHTNTAASSKWSTLSTFLLSGLGLLLGLKAHQC